MSPSPPFGTRTHCSPKADTIVLHEVEARNPRHLSKPRGFWYEVDGDWRRWCTVEQWGLDRLCHLHAVDLGASNVLRVATVDELDAFHRRFAGGRFDYIDWAAVGELYDGLEIAPYQWSRRLAEGMTWYYPWDCASGVIWRPCGASVTYLGPIELEAFADVP